MSSGTDDTTAAPARRRSTPSPLTTRTAANQSPAMVSTALPANTAVMASPGSGRKNRIAGAGEQYR